MENENMGYYDERALFVDGLGQLLKTALPSPLSVSRSNMRSL